MNKTILVIGIIFLLIGVNVVSSTNNIVDDINIDYQPIEYFDISKETSSRGNIAYAYDVLNYESFYFYLDDPENLTSFDILNCPVYGCATWTNFGKMLVCDGTGALWEINLCDRTASKIGGGGVTFNGLSYNPMNDKLYGITTSELYEIDINTGNQTYIGSLGVSNTMIAFAIDIDGNAYAWDVRFSGNAHLFSIDLETGEAKDIADMGECLIYSQSGCFDWSTGILWLAAYSIGGFLAYWDFDTQDLVHVSNLPSEFCGLVIPDTDDICPPVTTHSLNPPEPDGENGWYVSDVNVTLNASDDMSGVKEIKYRVDSGPIQTINGNFGTFTITKEDDADDLLVEYWAIDNAGNEEKPHKIFTIDFDQTAPVIDLVYEVIGGDPIHGWDFLFTATAMDSTSGVDYVVFYLNDELQDTVYGPGPTYEWILHYPVDSESRYWVRGLICNLDIIDEYIKFFALIVIVTVVGDGNLDIRACAYDKAGNWDCDSIEQPSLKEIITPGFYLFKSITFPNNYTGKISRFFINAIFDNN